MIDDHSMKVWKLWIRRWGSNVACHGLNRQNKKWTNCSRSIQGPTADLPRVCWNFWIDPFFVLLYSIFYLLYHNRALKIFSDLSKVFELAFNSTLWWEFTNNSGKHLLMKWSTTLKMHDAEFWDLDQCVKLATCKRIMSYGIANGDLNKYPLCKHLCLLIWLRASPMEGKRWLKSYWKTFFKLEKKTFFENDLRIIKDFFY